MRPSAKISVTPELVKPFADYYDKNPAWGSLHVVLDDGNYGDSTIKFCREYARERDDKEGVALADVLLQLSHLQRKKVARNATRASSFGYSIVDYEVTCDRRNNSPDDFLNVSVALHVPRVHLSFTVDKDGKVTILS